MYIQYQNAPKFTQLLSSLVTYLTIPIDQFYEHFFDLRQCDTQGLNNWGKILNQTRTVLAYNYAQTFGFYTGEANLSTTVYPQNFGHGSFFSTSTDTITVTLNDYQYRQLLLLLWQSYCVDCSLVSCANVINEYIQNQYNNPDYRCDIIEGSMSFTYKFNFALAPWEIALFELNQILPKPAGIKYFVNWSQ